MAIPENHAHFPGHKSILLNFYLSCVKIEMGRGVDGAAGMWPLGEQTDDVTGLTIVQQTH